MIIFIIMDDTDEKILQLLQQDCSRSLSELGSLVGLSVAGVNHRLHNLRTRGYIRAYVALINGKAIGLEICTFVSLTIDRPQQERAFIKKVSLMPEVQECHQTAGEHSFLLRIAVRDLSALDHFLRTKLKVLPGVSAVHSSIVL